MTVPIDAAWVVLEKGLRDRFARFFGGRKTTQPQRGRRYTMNDTELAEKRLAWAKRLEAENKRLQEQIDAAQRERAERDFPGGTPPLPENWREHLPWGESGRLLAEPPVEDASRTDQIARQKAEREQEELLQHPSGSWIVRGMPDG